MKASCFYITGNKRYLYILFQIKSRWIPEDKKESRQKYHEVSLDRHWFVGVAT